VASAPELIFQLIFAIGDAPGAATRTAYTVDAPPANSCSMVRTNVSAFG